MHYVPRCEHRSAWSSVICLAVRVENQVAERYTTICGCKKIARTSAEKAQESRITKTGSIFKLLLYMVLGFCNVLSHELWQEIRTIYFSSYLFIYAASRRYTFSTIFLFLFWFLPCPFPVAATMNQKHSLYNRCSPPYCTGMALNQVRNKWAL